MLPIIKKIKMAPVLNNKWEKAGKFLDYANTQFDK